MKKIILLIGLLVCSSVVFATSIGLDFSAVPNKGIPSQMQEGDKGSFTYQLTNNSSTDVYYKIQEATTQGITLSGATSGTSCVLNDSVTLISKGSSCEFVVNVDTSGIATGLHAFKLFDLIGAFNAEEISISTTITGGPTPTGGLSFQAVSGHALPSSTSVGKTYRTEYELDNDSQTTVPYTLTDLSAPGVTIDYKDASSTCIATGGSLPTGKACNIIIEFSPTTAGSYDHDVLQANYDTSKTATLNFKTTVSGVTIPTVTTTITGLPNGATVAKVSMNDNAGDSYEKDNQAIGQQEFATNVVPGSYNVLASNVTVGDTVYVPTLSNPYTLSTDSTNIIINYTEASSATTLAGWPDYIAMGNITIGVDEFHTTSGGNLDAAYTYSSINGDGSVGTYRGLPDLSKDIGGGQWHKVFYLLHASKTKALPTNTRAFLVYYTDSAGSGAMAGFGNDGTPHLTPYPTGNNDHEAPANLEVQYINLINFLALIRNEAAKQGDSLVADIAYNPDLLGAMYQKTFDSGSTNYLTLPLTDLKSALINAVQEKSVKNADGSEVKVQLDADAKKIMEDNLSSVLAAIDANGGETGKGYLNSINILTKLILGPTNCPNCTNIQFGWALNGWMAGGDANNLENTGSISTYASGAETFLSSTGLFSGQYAADFLVFDKYEADALTGSGITGGWFWKPQTWTNYITFIKTIADGLSQNRTYLPVADYLGSASEFSDSHLDALVSAHIVGIMWGGGDSSRTTSGFCPIGKGACQKDYNDDDGWLAAVMQQYEANPHSLNG